MADIMMDVALQDRTCLCNLLSAFLVRVTLKCCEKQYLSMEQVNSGDARWYTFTNAHLRNYWNGVG